MKLWFFPTICQPSNLVFPTICQPSNMNTCKAVCVYKDSSQTVTRVQFTPDGRHFIYSFSIRVNDINTKRQGIRIYDVSSKTLVRSLSGHDAFINELAVTSDNLCIVSASDDKTARVWQMESGTEVQRLQHDANVYAVAVTCGNKFIITGTRRGDSGFGCTVNVWQMKDGSLVHKMTGHTNSVCSVAVTPDNERVLSGSHDCTARVWRLADGKQLEMILFPHHLFQVNTMPDNLHFLVGCRDSVIYKYCFTSKQQPQLVCTFSPPSFSHEHRGLSERDPYLSSFSISTNQLVSVWSDGTIYVRDLQEPAKVMAHFQSDEYPILSVAMHPNCKQILACNGRLKMWTIGEWSDRNHQLFGSEFKALVFHLMCIKARLDEMYHKQLSCGLSRLPMAIWLQLFESLYYI